MQCIDPYHFLRKFAHTKYRGDEMTKNKSVHQAVDLVGAHATFPLADVKETEDKSNLAIPPEANVIEVKEWVDFKEM